MAFRQDVNHCGGCCFPNFIEAARLSGLLIWTVVLILTVSPQPAWVQEEPHLGALSPEVSIPSVALTPCWSDASRPNQPRKQPVSLPGFSRDTRVLLSPRFFLFQRDNYDRSRRAAWAGGGALACQSGYLGDRLALGAVGYASVGLYAPKDRDGSQLLKPGQRDIYVLGQLYGKIKVREDIVLSLFRKEYDTPYINRADTRMLPNTFEAYIISGRSGKLSPRAGQWFWQGGYFTRIKCKDSSSFIPMSRAAGVAAKRGVGMISGRFTSEAFTGDAFAYYSPDLITIIYTEAQLRSLTFLGLTLQLAGQFSHQASTGADLLLGRPFTTRQFGCQGDLGYRSAVLTLAFTANAIGGTNLHSFWGTYPGFTSVQVRDFNRAGEHALLLKGSYDFAHHGLTGLKAFVRWVRGWHRVNPVTRQPLPNEDEVNVDVLWQPSTGWWQDFSVRLRCARVYQRQNPSATLEDVRLIINYRLPIL